MKSLHLKALMSFCFVLVLSSLKAQISGLVTDADGNPLIAVTIMEKGTTMVPLQI